MRPSGLQAVSAPAPKKPDYSRATNRTPPMTPEELTIPARPEDFPARLEPFQFNHGAFDVTVVSDGHLVLPTVLLAPDAPAVARQSVLAAGGSSAAEYEPAANVTLIRSGHDLILFDTGGAGYQPQAGMLSRNLADTGIDPASVTKVVFTHGHPDHIWGTILPDGALRFPNAAYYSGALEWDFWMSDDVWTKLPSPSTRSPPVRSASTRPWGIASRCSGPVTTSSRASAP